MDPSKGTRRYKPLEGETQAYSLGNHREDESFDVVFDPPLMLYPTKPPKSARFNKVLFHAEFVVSDMLPDWRYDEENGKLDYALQEEFTDALRTTSMIKNFVELLAGCSWVDHVDLDFGLVAGWDTDQQRRGLPNHDPGEAHWNRLKKLWRKGDILVANIFLASGVLDPLQRLRNVRSWCIGLTVEDLEEEPPSTHERMTLDLSNAIKQTR